MSLNDIVEMLVACQGDLALAARGIEVDQDELTEALAIADADSAEAVAMRYLIKQE